MRQRTLARGADGPSSTSRPSFASGAGKRPGVLAFPEAFGPGRHAMARARRLAEA